MLQNEIYFFQDHSQGFIRIKHIDEKPTWDNTLWVHYYESVILEDLLELSVNLKSGCVKESYRKVSYMNSIHVGTNCRETKNIKVLHKIPDIIIEKVRSGIYDKEVKSFTFFSISDRRISHIFSKPILTTIPLSVVIEYLPIFSS